MDSSTLSSYRSGLYGCFTRSCDALMNLNDALLSDTAAHSFVELSQSPFFVREWSSIYAACENGNVDSDALRRLRVEHSPLPRAGKRLVLAGDASSIARPCSRTARDRTFVNQSNLPEGAKPVRPGWSFSFIVVPPEEMSSWVYTLEAERIQSDKTACKVMSEQLSRLTTLLTARAKEGGKPNRPLFLGDGGYGNVTFLAQTSQTACDCLVRLAKNRVLYRPKPERPDNPRRGRPAKDGTRFSCQNSETQDAADSTWSGKDAQNKKIEVACWRNLHFKQDRDLLVSVLKVTRHGAPDTKRDPKVCWFLFHGEQCPCLSEIPSLYARRYCIEHGFRFKKQDLLWEKVHLHTPERFSLWTDLVCCVENQLFIARAEGLAKRQAWESNCRPITPQQVRRGMNPILAALGTPARLSQPRGKSPGWPKGARRHKAQHFSVIQKTTKPAQKQGAIV